MEKVDVKLLQRFPRWRGYPPLLTSAAGACRRRSMRVTTSSWSTSTHHPRPRKQQRFNATLSSRLALPLPAKRSWTAHLIRYSGRSERCAVLWRVSHTVADGVVLSQIMSSVLCEPLSVDDEPPTMAGPPRPDLEARRPKRASVLERVWRILCGTLFVLALIFWPSDPHTCLSWAPSAGGTACCARGRCGQTRQVARRARRTARQLSRSGGDSRGGTVSRRDHAHGGRRSRRRTFAQGRRCRCGGDHQ